MTTPVGSTQDVDRELSLDQLDAVSGGFPVKFQDGILAIGMPGVFGIFIGAGCVGGWVGGTAIAVCP